MKRLWLAKGLLVLQRRRKRRRIGTGENGIERRRATAPNEVWGMDVVQDRTVAARPFRMLSVLDELTAIRGAPAHVRRDGGPEFVLAAARRWCAESGTGTLHIDPGSPWQNGIVESFHGRLRDELLSSEIFETLAEARYLVDRWRLHYNHRRPQRALGKMTPAGFAATCPAVPSLRLVELACAEAPRGGGRSLPCPNSHKGWTDESDPVMGERAASSLCRPAADTQLVCLPRLSSPCRWDEIAGQILRAPGVVSAAGLCPDQSSGNSTTIGVQ